MARGPGTNNPLIDDTDGRPPRTTRACASVKQARTISELLADLSLAVRSEGSAKFVTIGD